MLFVHKKHAESKIKANISGRLAHNDGDRKTITSKTGLCYTIVVFRYDSLSFHRTLETQSTN
jgi:hypothetical protein